MKKVFFTLLIAGFIYADVKGKNVAIMRQPEPVDMEMQAVATTTLSLASEEIERIQRLYEAMEEALKAYEKASQKMEDSGFYVRCLGAVNPTYRAGNVGSFENKNYKSGMLGSAARCYIFKQGEPMRKIAYQDPVEHAVPAVVMESMEAAMAKE